MNTYCVKSRKDTENIDPKIVTTTAKKKKKISYAIKMLYY